MQKVILTIGHKVGSVDVLDDATICQCVTSTMHVDAFTAIPCMGMWRGVPESSTRVEIVTDDPDSVTVHVPHLAWALNQEAIMCEVQEVNVTFPTPTIPAITVA